MNRSAFVEAMLINFDEVYNVTTTDRRINDWLLCVFRRQFGNPEGRAQVHKVCEILRKQYPDQFLRFAKGKLPDSEVIAYIEKKVGVPGIVQKTHEVMCAIDDAHRYPE